MPTRGKAPGMVTLCQYLIQRQRLHVERPKVRSEGEMFSRAGVAGFLMWLIVPNCPDKYSLFAESI